MVPARDEIHGIGRALEALARQVDEDLVPLDRRRFEVIVLANNCRDGTAEEARRFAASRPGLVVHVAEVDLPKSLSHVGTARRMLMDEAGRRLGGLGRGRGLICSTDADSRVAPGWLAATLREVRRGADAVGGMIRTDREGRASLGRSARRGYLLDSLYHRLYVELECFVDPDPADPWPRHDHHAGASLAVTVEAYRRAGGLPPLPTLEDVAFVEALRRVDARIRHSPDVRVTTSARRTGRVTGGLADAFRSWAERGEPAPVEHPGVSLAKFSGRARLRELWRADDPSRRRGLAACAEAVGTSRAVLADLLDGVPSFGVLVEDLSRLEGTDAGRGPDAIGVGEAIRLLREILRDLRRR